MNRYLAYGVTCVLLALAAATASATTIVMPTDEQLIGKTPLIVAGTVQSQRAVERDGAIFTDTTVTVERVLKGSAAETITIRELGGETSERFTVVFGAPEFEAGERVLLFLEPSPRGGYRTMDLLAGKFAEGRMMDGRRLWMRNESAANVTLLDADFEEIHAANIQRDAAAFETFVRERVAGRAGLKNYGIANPLLETKPRHGGEFEENFTLLAPPRIYRWTSFDSNRTASWYAGGTQTGYSGGGLTELQTAMSTWTGYSSAKILMSYSGTASAAYGGLSRNNGVNEVLFNDPLNEIAGSYSHNTGGVVGQGGFSGISGSSKWTAPFAADADHPAGTMTAYNIAEGNLTIQDGVNPSNNFSSNRLAEVLAHEFGHTLGFGHSADNSALMYAYVTGAGPSLKSDDQTAARWLYPNGSGGGTPAPAPSVPAAPSDLAAAASGSTVSLSWSDNATNETGYAVYVAAGNGAFARATDLPAGTRTATLNGFGAGSYRIYVAAFNGAGNSAGSNTVNVTIASQLTAAFSVSPQNGTAGVTTFTFYDETRGTVSSRVWDFGDGTSSTNAVANKVYARSGRYTVTLTVSGGGATSSAQNVVNVSGPLAASFNYTPANPTTHDTVAFSDQSTGGVTSWSWNFGDGSTSSAQNPTKRWTGSGTYNVTLTALRNGESSSTTRAIVVAAPAPVLPPVVAAFDATSTNVAINSNVGFTDRSANSPTSWHWNFGDGMTSNERNPVHTFFAAGTFTVTLTASNGQSSSIASKSVTVSQISPYRSLVSAAAQTNGLGGTVWRTELSLFNAGSQGASITLLFLPGAGGSMITRSMFLPPRQSATYANALLDLFGIGSGAGALAIEATSAGASAQLRITSRTFTSGNSGTYGQSVPDMQADAFGQTLYLTGMASNTPFRTNVGLVNRGAQDVNAALTLYAADGATLSTASVTVPANNFQQQSLATYFPQVAGRNYESLSMRVTSSASSALSVYASVLDNTSQDPVYIQAMPQTASDSVTLPVVGRSPGNNGTFWRSDVTIFNPSGDRATYSIRYAQATKTLSLGPRATFALNDVLQQMGFDSGTGALEITWNGNGAPIVASRTYTTSNAGTYGQSIDPVASFSNESWVPGLRSDVSYRSNVGFVNGGNEPEEFTVTLLSPSGFELASTTLYLEPKQMTQSGVTALFPSVSASTGNFTLYVRGDANAKLFAYGSMIDNGSGDPVFFAGR